MVHAIATWVELKHPFRVYKACIISSAHITSGPSWLVENLLMMTLAQLGQ